MVWLEHNIRDWKFKLKRFLEIAGDRCLLLSHVDADGLCSAEIVKRFLKDQGIGVKHIYPLKGENAYTTSTIQRISSLNPTSLIVLDLGVMDKPIAKDIPTLFIDHHKPHGIPKDVYLVSSYGLVPSPPTSLLAYALVKDLTKSNDLAWLGATGAMGDLGSDFPVKSIEEFGCLPKTKLKQAEVLINSAKRSSAYDIDTAIDLVAGATCLEDLTDPNDPRVKKLDGYRKEVNEEVRRCRHEPPIFSWKVAMIAFESQCDIQGLIAETWRRQLSRYIVIAANFGYIPTKVAYVVRSQLDVNLIEFMESMKPPYYNEHICFGHDKAGGGIIPREVWVDVAKKIGFSSPDGKNR